MKYIAAIDFNHMDNGVFLTALARSLTSHDNIRTIIIHGDSEYTERLIQTGIMRRDAQIRAIKDLNNRLVALFADQGVSTIGLNGYQRNLIVIKNEQLKLDRDYVNQLSPRPVLLLSRLAWNRNKKCIEPVPLPHLMSFLRKELESDHEFIFNADERSEIIEMEDMPENIQWEDISTEFQNRYIPSEFHNYGERVRLTTAGNLKNLPDLSTSLLLE